MTSHTYGPDAPFVVTVRDHVARATDATDAISLALAICKGECPPVGTPVTIGHVAGSSLMVGQWRGESVEYRDVAALCDGSGLPVNWQQSLPDASAAERSDVKVERGKKGTSRKVTRHGRVMLTTVDGVRMSESEVSHWATEWARNACDKCDAVRDGCEDPRHRGAIESGADYCKGCARGCGCMPSPVGAPTVAFQQLIHSDRAVARDLLADGIATGVPPEQVKRFPDRVSGPSIPLAGVAKSARDVIEFPAGSGRFLVPSATDDGRLRVGHMPPVPMPLPVKRTSGKSGAHRARARKADRLAVFSAAELRVIRSTVGEVLAGRCRATTVDVHGRTVSLASDRGRVRWSVDDVTATSRSADALVSRLAMVVAS